VLLSRGFEDGSRIYRWSGVTFLSFFPSFRLGDYGKGGARKLGIVGIEWRGVRIPREGGRGMGATISYHIIV